MKTRSIVLLFSIVAFFLLTSEDCSNSNSDVLKPDVEYYSSNYFLNDSLQVSDVITIGSDCRLTDATDALVVDEDANYFHFLSKAFVTDDASVILEVKRSDFKIRKVHINKTVAYIRNAPMNLDEIARWEESNDIEDYKETDITDDDSELEEVKFEDW